MLLLGIDAPTHAAAEPAVCPNCQTLHSMALVHNHSLFTDKQMIKLQESPGMER